MKNLPNYFILFWFYLNSILAQIDDDDKKYPKSLFDEIRGNKIESMNEIFEISKSSDSTFFITIYNKESLNSRKFIPVHNEVENRLGQLVDFYHFDCTGNNLNLTICERGNSKDGFPKMFVFVPPVYRINPYTKELNYHTQVAYNYTVVSALMIHKFIGDNIVSHVTKLTSDNIDDFLK